MSVSIKRQLQILRRLQYEIDYIARMAVTQMLTAYGIHKKCDEYIYSDWHEYNKLSDSRKSIVHNMVRNMLDLHHRNHTVFCYKINKQIKTCKELTREDHEIIHKKNIEGDSYILKEFVETSPDERTVTITRKLTDKIYFLKSEYDLQMVDSKNNKKGRVLPERCAEPAANAVA